MNFDYILADPTGNITVLVTTPYTDETRDAMIRESFRKEPSCEQVGFIMPVSDDVIRLEMMGYEFCGNATLSAAAWHAYTHGLKEGCETHVSVDSSGTDRILDVRISRLAASAGHPSFEGTVSMPVPAVTTFRGRPLVRFSGISHLIVPAGSLTEDEAETLVKEIAGELDVPAMGLLLCPEYDSLVSPDPLSGSISIRPLVYVPCSQTLFWEQGCATGSTAVGWFRSTLSGSSDHTEIKQPGGIIRVDVAGGQPYLTGRVTLLSL